MQGGTIPENALDPLFAAVGPPGLRVLDVSENYFRDAGVARLCEAPWAGSLTWLGLARNYLTDEAVRLIATSGRFGGLRLFTSAGTPRRNSRTPIATTGSPTAASTSWRTVRTCPGCGC